MRIKIMQNLQLLLGKEKEYIQYTTRRHENEEELNSYSNLVGDAIAYSSDAKAEPRIYKLDYQDDIEEMVEL